MPADEVSTGSDVDAACVRTTGPRHAAPKKPLFTRFHMPAGKAIALAAMPTAVLMGMGFTPTLANADDQPSSKNLTIDEYKDCVAALEGADASASASPSPSASPSASKSADDSGSASQDDSKGSSDGAGSDSGGSKDTSGSADSTDGKSGSSSSGSGSGDAAEPAPSASSSPAQSATSGDTPATTPSATETSKNLLETVGDALTDLFDGKKADDTATASPSPSASPSAEASAPAAGSGSSGASDTSKSTDKGSTGTSKETGDAGAGAAKDTAEEAARKTADKVKEAAKDAKDTAADATATPSPSSSAGANADDCPAATDDEGGIDNKVRLPDDPWFLNASSLLLKGADYQGIVKVKTANGTVKEVLKYVISGGTDIGDLHQTVDDKQANRTYHVQAGKGTTSTIKDGDTVMYTESISGNLFGLIPVTFSPKSPPPLNIPLIYFTNAKVQQAGQFGGTLTVPGLHQYTTAG
ncbi:hypothetical protein [Streptomyces hilarionis]|uniref:hypothetical protein n=1 Tax=Streptomyces hilarionis TaxID=2839954 RepID=UPI00211AA4C9|nr:hypothetical protein [Streptomyces hilarionis]MCQ9132644.1 hypothetical protein [Streptomyces hilarionis]